MKRLWARWILWRQNICRKHLKSIHYQMDHYNFGTPAYCCNDCFAEQKDAFIAARDAALLKKEQKRKWAESVLR